MFTIYDCFSTTTDKVDTLMTILKSVYINLYSNEPYLRKFDKGVLDTIKANYVDQVDIDEKSRIIT